MSWDLILSNSLYTAVSANAIAYMLVALGLNVHFGYTGLLNFGQAGFAAIGAYSLSIPISRYDWPWPFAVLLLVVSSILLALLLGIPTLRLRADYLAIVSLGSPAETTACKDSRVGWKISILFQKMASHSGHKKWTDTACG